MRTLLLATILLAAGLAAHAQLDSPAIDSRVEALLARMTLEEKIGQLVQFSAGTPTGPTTGRADYREQIAKGQLGSLLNLTGAAVTNEMQRIAVEKSRLGIPLLFGLDVIHGYRTIFPVPLGLASTWEPRLVEQAAQVAAQEASAEGVRWTFSPMVDIARDARWGRIVEGAGEDPLLGAAMAAAYVRGYQGARLSDPDSIAACAKHYVGYGAAEGGRDYAAAEISERTLREVYLPPFHAVVEAGAASLMSAFNTVNGVPQTADRRTLTDILRGEWKFRGPVVSDWQAIEELIAHGIANDGATAARKALTAGVDIDMESGLYARTLAGGVGSGALPIAVVDEAVRRVLRLKFALGLFEHPYTTESAPRAPAIELAREIAERSLVLLKNAEVNGAPLLPLKKIAKLALVGPLADSKVNMLGSWAGKGDPQTAVTLRAALAERLGNRLFYAKGTEIDTTSDAGFAEALAAAEQADVVIAAMGEDAAQMTAEAASRASLGLPGNQQRLLEALAGRGKPVVLVLFNGRPLALPWAAAHVPAIVEAWYPGMQAGAALARVLFGEADFSGRLTVSFPRSVGQEPLYYNALSTGRPANGVDLSHPPTNSAEKYVSRYIDEQNSPQFPFGFGLSYTRFSYSPIALSGPTLSAREVNADKASLRVSATVTNTGDRPGREIAQLYLRQRGTSVALPVRQLKGFQTVELRPGESRRVEFTVGREQLAFWNLQMRHEAEPAQVTVWIAPNSADGPSGQFTITP